MPTCQYAVLQSVFPERECCTASLILVRVVPTGEAGHHQMIAAPSSAASSKALGTTNSTGWTCLQKDLLWTSDHEKSCVLLLLSNHKFHHFSITQFMCRKHKSSQNFNKHSSLFYSFIKCWLRAGALQKTNSKLPYCPRPRCHPLSNPTTAFPDRPLVYCPSSMPPLMGISISQRS